MTGLTHVRADGTAAMVDVGGKEITERTAVAGGVFCTTPRVIEAIRAGGVHKGDVLAAARLAGIMGAKRTAEIIPLCHPLPLNKVEVDFALGADRIVVTATASTTGRTGVEMEALTAVTIAGLTLHDMVKALDPAARLTDVSLREKTGGRHGHWVREDYLGRRDAGGPGSVSAAGASGASGDAGASGASGDAGAGAGVVDLHDNRRASVLVSSTRIAVGERDDKTGPVIADWLRERGFDVAGVRVVADAHVAGALAAVLAEEPAVVITTGGTGPTGDDTVPEATAPYLTKPMPGIAEAMRAKGLAVTPYASLSRGLTGLAGRTFVANLPGSTGGVRDGLDVLGPLLDHLFAMTAKQSGEVHGG